MKDRCNDAQHGQATVEFVVVALFFLVPLSLAIVALGKFIDVQHTMDMAARYAAWERTVWYDQDASGFGSINQPNYKSAGAINNEIGARLFTDRSNPVSVINSSDQGAGRFVNGTDPMWRDTAGSPYLANYAQLSMTGNSETPNRDVAGQALGVLTSVQVSGIASFVPPLPAQTLAVGTVSLKGIAKNSQVYQRLWADSPGWQGLDFSAPGAILSNTWSANTSGGTREMVTKMVPTAQSLGQVVRAASAGILAWDPTIPPRIEVGKIVVDEVPPDRLK